MPRPVSMLEYEEVSEGAELLWFELESNEPPRDGRVAPADPIGPVCGRCMSGNRSPSATERWPV